MREYDNQDFVNESKHSIFFMVSRFLYIDDVKDDSLLELRWSVQCSIFIKLLKANNITLFQNVSKNHAIACFKINRQFCFTLLSTISTVKSEVSLAWVVTGRFQSTGPLAVCVSVGLQVFKVFVLYKNILNICRVVR